MKIRVKLSDKWIAYLIKQPESGMGYHRVNVTFEDGTWLGECVVYNGEEIEFPDHMHASKKIKGIKVIDSKGRKP